MNKLEQELRKAANSPKMTAVRFSKANEATLTKNYKIGRGMLRQVAVLIDKQVKNGMVATPIMREAAKEKKVKLAKAKVPKDVPKADAKPPKAKKPKAKPKLKKKS